MTRTRLSPRTCPNDSCKAAFIIANCAFSFSTLDGLANDSRAASSAIYAEQQVEDGIRVTHPGNEC